MSTPQFDAKAFLATVPLQPGVYRFLDADARIIYVGKARVLKNRVSSYFQKQHASPRTTLMVSKIASAEFTVTATEKEALLLENNLIKRYQPRYNVVFRDDKSYPYIMMTGHVFPQIRFYRGVHVKPNRYFGPFPNAWAVRDTISHVQKVFRIRTCDDTVFAHRSRPCLLHQIGRCSAPCVGLVSTEDYARDLENAALFLQGKEDLVIGELTRKMEHASQNQEFEAAALFRDQIRALQRVLTKQFVETKHDRDADVVTAICEHGVWCVNLVMIRGGRHLGDKSFFPANTVDADVATVLEAFLLQHYSEQTPPPRVVLNEAIDASELTALFDDAGDDVRLVSKPSGESRSWIMMSERNARVAVAAHIAQAASQGVRERALFEAIEPYLPELKALSRIECFDISHTMGEATVASCVVYEKGKMQPAQYRRYNVKNVTAGDDYAAMQFAMKTRFEKLAANNEDVSRGAWPDLLLIDGGVGQLNSALSVFDELGIRDQLAVLGVAKGVERKAGMEELVFPGGTAVKLGGEHPGLHLIQQVRDEAHRFAITGHRAQRGKARLHSSLEDIDGIGTKRRQALLKRFGGLQGVKSASIDDLMKAEGISRELAERIFNALH